MIITPNIAGGDIVLTNVLATIAVPNASRLDISSDGNKLFVLCDNASYQQSLAVISTATNTVLATTALGQFSNYSGLYGFCANPARPDLMYFHGGRQNNSLYYVTLNASNVATVGYIGSNTNDIDYTANDIVVNKAGTRLYATRALSNANTLYVWDISSAQGNTPQLAQSVPASGTLSNNYGDQVTVTPDGSKVFVANQWSNFLNRYNCEANGNIVTTSYARSMPFSWVGYTSGMAMSPKGDEFMSWGGAWERFARHSTSFNYTDATSAEGGRLVGMHSFFPNDAAYSVDGSMIYFTKANKLYAAKTAATSSVYDGSSLTWAPDSVSITGANRLVMGKDGTRAYVVGTNTITVLGPK